MTYKTVTIQPIIGDTAPIKLLGELAPLTLSPKFMPMKMAEQQRQVVVVVVASEHYNQRNRDSMTRYRRHQSTDTQSTSARRLGSSRQRQVVQQQT